MSSSVDGGGGGGGRGKRVASSTKFVRTIPSRRRIIFAAELISRDQLSPRPSKNLATPAYRQAATSGTYRFLPSVLVDIFEASVSQAAVMAWQRPNCIVQAMQPLRRGVQLHSYLQPSVFSASPLSPISTHLLQRQRRSPFSTSSRKNATEVRAAPEIDFSKFRSTPARIVPASPAYFSGSPKFIDHMLSLERLLAKYASLPTVAPNEAPRMAWFKLAQFRDFVGEHVPTKKYKNLIKILQRLNRIEPALMPEEVRETLKTFLRPGNPYANKAAPAVVDEMGRARGTGKRKEASAVVYLVEGEGEVLVNGRNIVDVFPRVHDRESALWALRCTGRLDKYNVWATVKGGGVTGQAEAITLAVARALLVHEPALKPVLRQGTLPRYPSCHFPPHRHCGRGDELESISVVLLCHSGDPVANDDCFPQPGLLRSMPVAWRGRSQAIGKQERCQPGSRDERYLSFMFLSTLYYSRSPSISRRRYILYLSRHIVILSKQPFDLGGLLVDEASIISSGVS